MTYAGGGSDPGTSPVEAEGLQARASSRRTRSMVLRRLAKFAKVGLGLVLLWLAFRGVDLAGLVRAIARVQPGWLGLTLLLVGVGLAAKAYRWYCLLRPLLPKVRMSEVLGALLSGQAINMLAFARGGDMARALLVGAGAPEKIPAVLTGILVEKALDMLVLAVLLVALVPVLPGEMTLAVSPAWLLGMGIALLIASLLAVQLAPSLWPSIRKRLDSRPGPWAPRLAVWGERLAASLSQLSTMEGKGAVLASTGVAWLAMASTNWATAASLNIGMGWAAALLVLVLVLIGVIPALMPGHVGPFYFFARYGLEQFGVDSAEAAAFAVLLHAVSVGPVLIGAALYLMFGRWNQLRRWLVEGG